MMIRKWPLDELDSVRGEQAEKASGMADAGDGVYALAAKFLERSADACASEGSCRKRCDRSDRPGRKAHLEKPLCMHPCRLGREPLAGRAVADERIRAREMARALPQRPCRQQPTIAKPALAIDDDDLAVARQAKMLQAIIADDHLHAGCDRCACGRDAVGADEDGATAATLQQKGLIADLAPVRIRA